MAFTLAQLQDMRDALYNAIMGGVQLVRYSDGRTVQYSSFDDMRKALTLLDRDIAAASSTTRPSFTYAQYSKDGRGNGW